MTRPLAAVALAGLLLAAAPGCAPRAARPDGDPAKDERARCSALEVYPLGVRPSRPYRSLGVVQATRFRTSVERDDALRQEACTLGADAVIDVEERGGSATAFGASGEAPGSDAVASGTAVKFLAEAPPAAQ
jgi:hypothetical protein